MDERNARDLLERLGCRKIRSSGKEISASCPFSENHYRGDRRSSFGAAISDDPNDVSPYHCFGCHSSGTLERLAINNGFDDLVPEWQPKKVDRDWINVPATNIAAFRNTMRKKEEPVFFEDQYIEPFTGLLSAYLKHRGILLDTAKAWELGVDKPNKRAMFIVRDMEGRLAVLIGRDTTNKSQIKYTNYVFDRKHKRFFPFIDHNREEDFIGPTKRFFLYGELFAKRVHDDPYRKSNDLVVVEGPMDVLNVWQYGLNVVGVMGSYPSQEQVDKMIKLVPEGGRLITLMDADKAGRDCVTEIGRRAEMAVPILDAQLPEGLDLGDASKEEVFQAIGGAEILVLTGKT